MASHFSKIPFEIWIQYSDILYAVFLKKFLSPLQGCSKDGKAPDGTSYVEAAEKEEIKQLLR